MWAAWTVARKIMLSSRLSSILARNLARRTPQVRWNDFLCLIYGELLPNTQPNVAENNATGLVEPAVYLSFLYIHDISSFLSKNVVKWASDLIISPGEWKWWIVRVLFNFFCLVVWWGIWGIAISRGLSHIQGVYGLAIHSLSFYYLPQIDFFLKIRCSCT